MSAVSALTVRSVGLGREEQVDLRWIGQLDRRQPTCETETRFESVRESWHEASREKRGSDEPSCSGSLFNSAGLSPRALLTLVITPDTGAKMSDAALTDSTAPICSGTRTSLSRQSCPCYWPIADTSEYNKGDSPPVEITVSTLGNST